jgi:transketolase
MGSTRAAFGDTVLQLAREGRDIVVVTSDTCSSMGLERFAAEYPGRHIEVGIAEQNLMMVAAGLAAGGRTVFAATYAAFASLRALEQVRTFIAYPRLRVVIAAGLGGLSAGIEGAAHLAMEDIGILRCVPGLTILNPSDAPSAAALVRAAADVEGPVYIRLGRDDSPVVHHDGAVSIGSGVILANRGRDVALMASGFVTAEVLTAAARLEAGGIGCTVIEFPTLKPIDRGLVAWAGTEASAIVTVEEHSVIGGLGTAVMEVLAETTPAIVHRIGIHDVFLESGSPQQLRAKFGLTAESIAGRVRAIVDRQRRERRKE